MLKFLNFASGIPELRVNSLDPMVVTEISLNQGNGPVSITSTFKDLHIQGFSDVQVHDVKCVLYTDVPRIFSVPTVHL